MTHDRSPFLLIPRYYEDGVSRQGIGTWLNENQLSAVKKRSRRADGGYGYTGESHLPVLIPIKSKWVAGVDSILWRAGLHLCSMLSVRMRMK